MSASCSRVVGSCNRFKVPKSGGQLSLEQAAKGWWSIAMGVCRTWWTFVTGASCLTMGDGCIRCKSPECGGQLSWVQAPRR